MGTHSLSNPKNSYLHLTISFLQLAVRYSPYYPTVSNLLHSPSQVGKSQ